MRNETGVFVSGKDIETVTTFIAPIFPKEQKKRAISIWSRNVHNVRLEVNEMFKMFKSLFNEQMFQLQLVVEKRGFFSTKIFGTVI